MVKAFVVGRLLVRLAGLEPAARGLGNRCSIHLSYRRIFGNALQIVVTKLGVFLFFSSTTT